MKINGVDGKQSFQAGFANDAVTRKVLGAVKKDIMCTPTIGDCVQVNGLLHNFEKVCRFEDYRLTLEKDKLIMTSVIPNKYRNTEPVKDSLAEGFMRLIGKFVNLKS